MRGGRRAGRFAAILAAAVLAAAMVPSRSGVAAPIVALYDAFWAGLPAARIRLEFDGGDRSYRDSIAIRTAGLPRLVTRFRGTATAAGLLAPEGAAEPLRYDALYDLRRRRNSRISMRFVGEGGDIEAERGPGDTSHHPPLAAAYRRDAVDPLTALERIREAVGAALHTGRTGFRVPVYDGARRFDVVGRLLPRRGSGPLQVALTLHPIAGFKGQTSDDGDPDDAPRPARLWVSDDARLLPLRVEVPIWYLPLVVRLDRVCSTASGCAL